MYGLKLLAAYITWVGISHRSVSVPNSLRHKDRKQVLSGSGIITYPLPDSLVVLIDRRLAKESDVKILVIGIVLVKHEVSFEEARTVFYDEDAIQFYDPDHSDEEDRFILLELSFRDCAIHHRKLKMEWASE